MNYIKLFEEFNESLNESVLPKAQELLDICEETFPQLKEVGRGFPIRMTRTEIVIRWKGPGGLAIFKVEDVEGAPVITQFTVGERDVLSGGQQPLSGVKDIKF